MLVKDKKIYNTLVNAIKERVAYGEYLHIHAIYEPDENGMYCVAMDLFEEGETYRAWLVMKNDSYILINNIKRWYMG